MVKQSRKTSGKIKVKRRTKKQRKSKHRKHQSRKQKGGMCYGSGVGANSYDPNISIHNTNLLQLFPYKIK